MQFVDVLVSHGVLVDPDEDEIEALWAFVPIKAKWNVWQRRGNAVTIWTAWGERPIAQILLDEEETAMWDAFDGEKRLIELRGRFDRVIVDSPPVSPVTDAVILSTRTDGVVFVVRSHSSTIDQVRHSLRSLRSVKGKVLGVILNAVDLRRLEYKYSYNYRYYTGYGDYAQSSPKANS